LMEIQRVEPIKNMKSSWFVDNGVVSDDSVYVMTKMDPNYLLLSVLEACEGNRFMELHQTLGEVGFTWIQLLKCQGLDATLICDVNDVCGPDQLFYRLSETKTMEWLKLKCERIAKKLMSTTKLSKQENNNTEFVNGFVTLNSVKKSSSAGDDDKDSNNTDSNDKKRKTKYLATAVEVLQGYISDRWTKLLKQRLGLEDVKKTINSSSLENHNITEKKRSRTSDLDDALGYVMGGTNGGNNKKAKTQQQTTSNQIKSLAQRRLAKTSTKGMKSMFSFFKKK